MISAVWSTVEVASLVLLFSIAVKVVASRPRGLRLTDWPGIAACVAGLIAVPSVLWDKNPWLLLLLPLAVVWGLVESHRVVQVWRRGTAVEGQFLLGRAPDGVLNRWPSVSRQTPPR